MAKFATAFVEIEPDLSKFGSGLGKEIEARLRNLDVSQGIERNIRPKFSGIGRDLADAIKDQVGPEFEKAVAGAADALNNAPRRQTSEVDLDIRRAQAQSAQLRAELADLSHTKATPEVDLRATKAKAELDEIQVRLAHLRAENAEIKIDVDKSAFSQIEQATGNIGQAFRGVAVSLGGLLGVGGAFTGLADAAAAALPVVAALSVAIGVLVASFAAAVAGAGALGIALAGAFGPALAVVLVAAAKIAQILKAIHDDGKGAAASSQALASAQDQLQSATEGVASAQSNLKQQTTAAYQAWADSIEAVHKDLLDVKDAQLGIEDAQLSFREATLALKEFKAQVPGLDSVFKKFTDVNVDLSGLHGALEAARKSSGGKLSEDDTLKLERLILNVRKAKLGEAQATDRLHNSNTQLARDRQTEVKFAQEGIRAYPGYAAAVTQVASAERQRAAAVRAVTAAQVAQAGEVAKLTPIQQKLAATFKNVSKAFNLAFSPALDALFTGLNRALTIFVRVLSDPRIVHALTGIGKAFGGVFVTLAQFAASREGRDALVTLANGAAKLIRVVGGKAFLAFAKILTSIATAALPALVGLFSELAGTLDRWAQWIQKHPKQFRKDIESLIGSFKGWLGVILDVGGFLLDLGGKLKDLGDTAGRIFRDIKGTVKDILDGSDKVSGKLDKLNTQHLQLLSQQPTTGPGARSFLGFDAQDLDAIGAAFRRVKGVFNDVINGVKGPFHNLLAGFTGTFRGFVRIVAGLISGKWSEAWRGLKTIVVSQLRGILGLLGLLVSPFKIVGQKLGLSFSRAFRAAINGLKSAAQAVVNALISIINFGIRQIDKVLRSRDLGPLGHTPDLRIGQIPHVDFTGNKRKSLNPGNLPTLTKTPSKPRANASSADGGLVQQFGDIVLPPAPKAAVPDARYQARQFFLEVAKAGG